MFNKKRKIIVNINGMSCNHCSKKVQNALVSIDGVYKVKVDLNKNQAIIFSQQGITHDLINKAITDIGYQVIEIAGD